MCRFCTQTSEEEDPKDGKIHHLPLGSKELLLPIVAEGEIGTVEITPGGNGAGGLEISVRSSSR